MDRANRRGRVASLVASLSAALLTQGCPLELKPFDSTLSVDGSPSSAPTPEPTVTSPPSPTTTPPSPACPSGQQPCGDGCIPDGASCDCTSDAECVEQLANVVQAQCVSGQCNVATCSAAAYDCDGIAANGCEILLNDQQEPTTGPLMAVTPKPLSAEQWQGSGPWYSLGAACPSCAVPTGLPGFSPGVQGAGAADLQDGDLSAAVRVAWNGGGLHLYFFHADDDLSLNPNPAAEPLEAAAWKWDNFEVVWDADPSQGNGADGSFLFVALDGTFVEYLGDDPVSQPDHVITKVETAGSCRFLEVTLDSNFLSGRSGPGQGLPMQADNLHGLAIAVNDFDRSLVGGEEVVRRQHQLFLQTPPTPLSGQGGYWFERPISEFPMVQLSP